MVSGQMPPRKIAPVRVRVWFSLGSGLELGLGAIFLERNCPRTKENITFLAKFKCKKDNE